MSRRTRVDGDPQLRALIEFGMLLPTGISTKMRLNQVLLLNGRFQINQSKKCFSLIWC